MWRYVRAKIALIVFNSRNKITWITDLKTNFSVQMEKRLSPAPEGVDFPVWAWHTRDWQHKKPDLRSSDMRHFTEPYVCIELEVPDNEVLLSDFDAWHYVLNDFPCIECHSEEEFDQIYDNYSAMKAEEQEKVKTESWNRIFDITPIEDEWNINGKYIQASFWELKPEYVVSVRHIKEKRMKEFSYERK